MYQVVVYTPEGPETHLADGYALEDGGSLTVYTVLRMSLFTQVTYPAGRWVKVEQTKVKE